MAVRGDFHPLRVARVDRLCDDAAAVTFDVPDDLTEEFRFRAGQSLTLRRRIDDHEERRQYSICAPVGAAPRVGVRVVPDGLFSEWLVEQVRAGDEIEVQTPSGTFGPDPDLGGHHVLIAAGSGITPVLSIASSLLANPEAEVTLLYGNRRANTVMFTDEVADLKDRFPARFEVIHVLSREPRDVELFSGRLDADRLRRILTALVPVAAVDGYWLCGPFEMIESARDVLRELGVPAERVHRELFFVDDIPPPPVEHAEAGLEGPSSRVTMTLDGRTTALTLPRDRPVLDAAQEIRADLPYACKGGVCGTCRAKVVSGEVHMRRNYALEDDELADGYVLTCQSLPVSDELSLDYDA
ncbi:1,2-phenylacetyl-CoA epoxidase subunit PaaE [Aeromicrobium sp.]|uniref:1,2-phenylacetyl-CoA epoxidase subunit PaaE n=1 Tax=Aeromicrobium sp. TaxID=1871063 RepID=UPI003D6B0B8B